MNKNKIGKYKESNNIDLEKLIDDYSGYVYTIIENMAGNTLSNEDKEEIISDTFFVLWKNKNKIKEEKILSSYIAGIVRNLVKLKSRTINLNNDINFFENTITDMKNIDLLCEQRDKIEIIENALLKMKEQDRVIFNLYYYSSMKITEISKKLNISDFNVKSRLHRIRKRLKKELEKGGYSYGK
ncbi:MAG: sigma-70 family RNA polymerase sigma factor [Clostridia bacterium]|nr:sigma-70 family RNA polymerase sigma factor [Clostridia bacterium]